MQITQTNRSIEPQEYPVLILGGGRGGSAILEMFIEDRIVRIVGVVDANPLAPALTIAHAVGIPTFTDNLAALNACRAYPNCIIYNLTNDDSVAQQVAQVLGEQHRVATGLEARLFWHLVTNIKQLKKELERSQNHLQAIIRNVLDGIITVNAAGEICGFNPAAEKLFGCAADSVMGQPVMRLLAEEADNFDRNLFVQCLTDSTQLVQRTLELRGLRADAAELPLEISLSDMDINGQRFVTLIARDISQRKQAEQRLTYLAHHDFLTNLPNRALFLDRLKYSLLLAQRSGTRLAVIFLDLDGFKAVNDTQGHQVGDYLLQGVAQRLQAVVRTSDTVARLGGDEFTMVLNNIGENKNAEAVALKIIETLSQPFEFEDVVCRIGASIGISFFEAGEMDAESLLEQADAAMYRAKEAGKNTWRIAA